VHVLCPAALEKIDKNACINASRVLIRLEKEGKATVNGEKIDVSNATDEEYAVIDKGMEVLERHKP
jgi:3-methyladenine DNA glycosylase Mpg